MFFELVKDMLLAEGIESISAISLKNCIIKKPYLLEKAGIDKEKGNAVIFTVPYYVNDETDRNISLYAVSRDYHLYFAELSEKILSKLKEQYPNNAFALFSDHSPIDEVHAASAAGLGIIGKNHLLITEKYSSFVFIGSIMTDVCFDTFFSAPKECENCGRCYAACPCHLDSSKCISALSQKKGELSETEKNALILSGTAWGCDACQIACPHSVGISETKISFFLENRIPNLTSDLIEEMNDEQFSSRAYSWRGKNTILRNLKLYENGDKNE